MNYLSELFTNNKDLLTLVIGTLTVCIALGTLMKAIFEYKLQGRQKRAELFDKFKTTSKTEERIIKINGLLEAGDNQELLQIPLIDKYYYLGFYEQISIAVNSGLIKKDVAHYMFGYFALRCWESKNFWFEINKESYYWSVFKKFVESMQNLEDRNFRKKRSIRIWDRITGRSNFKF